MPATPTSEPAWPGPGAAPAQAQQSSVSYVQMAASDLNMQAKPCLLLGFPPAAKTQSWSGTCTYDLDWPAAKPTGCRLPGTVCVKRPAPHLVPLVHRAVSPGPQRSPKQGPPETGTRTVHRQPEGEEALCEATGGVAGQLATGVVAGTERLCSLPPLQKGLPQGARLQPREHKSRHD